MDTECPYLANPQRQKAREWLPGAGGREHGERLLNGYRVSLGGDASRGTWVDATRGLRCPPAGEEEPPT